MYRIFTAAAVTEAAVTLTAAAAAVDDVAAAVTEAAVTLTAAAADDVVAAYVAGKTRHYLPFSGLNNYRPIVRK